MAKEIKRNIVLGNFRSLRKAARKNSEWRSKRPGMDEEHLANIRLLPCCVCLKVPGGQVHHLKSGTGERGMSVRSTDKWGVPMCFAHHEEVERAGTRNESAYFRDNAGGLDPHELAIALWSNKGSLARMLAVLKTHRGVKGRR